jgi:hypothetical protein
LVKGIQKEFLSGNPTPATPNAITSLLKLLTGALGLGDIFGGILNGVNLTQLVTDQVSPLAANALPSADAKVVTLSADPDSDVSTGKHAAAADAPVPEDTGTTPKHAKTETATDETETATANDETATDETETAADETPSATTDPDASDDESGSTTSPKPSSPTTPRNPVGDVVGGATHAVAGAVGGVTHEVESGVADVLKSLAPKKKTTTTTTTTTTTKSETEKDSTGGGTGGATNNAAKPAA